MNSGTSPNEPAGTVIIYEAWISMPKGSILTFRESE